VTPFTAPAVPHSRPPAAPDPVTGVTLPTTIPPNHCTTMQFGQPPNGTVQTTPATVALPETHDPYDCHHSEMQLSDPMEEAVQPAPVIGSYANTSGYAICSASPIVIPHHLALPAKGNPKDYFPQEPICDVLRDTNPQESPWDNTDEDNKELHRK